MRRTLNLMAAAALAVGGMTFVGCQDNNKASSNYNGGMSGGGSTDSYGTTANDRYRGTGNIGVDPGSVNASGGATPGVGTPGNAPQPAGGAAGTPGNPAPGQTPLSPAVPGSTGGTGGAGSGTYSPGSGSFQGTGSGTEAGAGARSTTSTPGSTGAGGTGAGASIGGTAGNGTRGGGAPAPGR